MGAHDKGYIIQKTKNNRGSLRVVVSAALIATMLSGCSVVPDAVNPVKWYQKTTDFFSGDRQAATPQTDTTGGPETANNSGLAADPNAPPPAQPTQELAKASGGLSGDQVSSNYASPPLERQGAPRDVLVPQDTAALNEPPAPMAQPVIPVVVAPSVQMAKKTQTLAPIQPVPPMHANNQPRPQLTPPKRLSFADAPPPPNFNIPSSSANTGLGGDQFETVVISGDGLGVAAEPKIQRKFALSPQKVASSGARFPDPGKTTNVGPVNDGSLTRVATIHFANNSSNMDNRDRSILEAVIQLQKERGGRVVVVGHASSRTRDMNYIKHQMVNFEISMKRATTIANALKSQGLNGSNLDVQAVSDSQPQFLEVMPSGEVGNRRVEIYLAAS